MTLFDGGTEETSNTTERSEVGSNWHFALSLIPQDKTATMKVTQHVNFFPQNCHLTQTKVEKLKITLFLPQ